MAEENEINNNIKNELEECKKLCDEYLAGWQRCKADFLNYKKEELQKIGDLIELAKSQWILEFLKVIDNWERAMKHKPDDLSESAWLKGIEMIEAQLKDFLKAQGVEEMQAAGQKFNPELHEAIEEVESGEAESGTIIEVLEKGYTINNKLLRPAKVKFCK